MPSLSLRLTSNALSITISLLRHSRVVSRGRCGNRGTRRNSFASFHTSPIGPLISIAPHLILTVVRPASRALKHTPSNMSASSRGSTSFSNAIAALESLLAFATTTPRWRLVRPEWALNPPCWPLYILVRGGNAALIFGCWFPVSSPPRPQPADRRAHVDRHRADDEHCQQGLHHAALSLGNLSS